MRAALILLPLLIAAPAAAQRPAPQLPPELADPAMGEKMGRMMGAMTRALMDLPVGEIEAAVRGREPTAADRRKRVRDVAGSRDLERRAEAAGPAMQRGMQALAGMLPSLMKAAEEMEDALDRATANLPDPNYPKR